MEWPEEFSAQRAGVGCPMCEDGRPDRTVHGVRFFAGEVSDGYLVRAEIQRGLCVVVWRGRHVAEPTDLTEDPRPGWPFPFPDPDPPPMPEGRLMRDVDALREATAASRLRPPGAPAGTTDALLRVDRRERG